MESIVQMNEKMPTSGYHLSSKPQCRSPGWRRLHQRIEMKKQLIE
jgi:hypothetical protein